jgi:hypothetical protein
MVRALEGISIASVYKKSVSSGAHTFHSYLEMIKPFVSHAWHNGEQSTGRLHFTAQEG